MARGVLDVELPKVWGAKPWAYLVVVQAVFCRRSSILAEQ